MVNAHCSEQGQKQEYIMFSYFQGALCSRKTLDFILIAISCSVGRIL